MELKDIVSVSGKPGLYNIVGRRKNGLIVESIDAAKKRMPTNLTQKVSVLGDISIYTIEAEEKLANVLKELHKQVGAGLVLPASGASKEDLGAFMSKVLKDYDTEKVYSSDIKKLVQWYSILSEHTDITKLVEEKEENKEAKTDTKAKTSSTKKPTAKKSTPKVKANSRAGGAKKSSVVKASGRGK